MALPETLAKVVLTHLRKRRAPTTVARTAADLGISIDEVLAGLDAIEAELIVRVRGQGGSIQAA